MGNLPPQARNPQKVDYSRGPVADYSKLRSPLPKPPDGLVWQKNGKDWVLVAKECNSGDSMVENVDYVVHKVTPSDTIQGICLRYHVTATKLRQVNKFSGTNLLLAPSNLIIPISKTSGELNSADATG